MAKASSKPKAETKIAVPDTPAKPVKAKASAPRKPKQAVWPSTLGEMAEKVHRIDQAVAVEINRLSQVVSALESRVEHLEKTASSLLKTSIRQADMLDRAIRLIGKTESAHPLLKPGGLPRSKSKKSVVIPSEYRKAKPGK